MKKFANTKLRLPNPAYKMAFERILYSNVSSHGFGLHELPADTSDQVNQTKHLGIWRLSAAGFVVGGSLENRWGEKINPHFPRDSGNSDCSGWRSFFGSRSKF